MGLCLVGLDKALHRYEAASERSWPKRLIRGAALREAERWMVARQEADGSWGGIQPPMVYSTIALVLRGYPLDHPVVKAALLGLERFTLDDEKGRRIEACQSPIWDTALSVIALVDAGAADDPCVEEAVEWLLDKEVTVVGDWAVRRPALAPGGWSFEFENVNYPDIDDTAEVVLALRRAMRSRRGDPACDRALDWVVGMRSNDGGWGAFDADNNSGLPTQLPFFDFGAVTDPPTADVTAHVVEMLACEDRPLKPAWQEALKGGLQWLIRQPGAGRVVLGPLGGQLRLRDRRRAAGPRRRRRRSQATRGWPTVSVGWLNTRTPTAVGVKTCARTSSRDGRAGGPLRHRRRRGR